MNKDGTSPVSMLRFVEHRNKRHTALKNTALDLLIAAGVNLGAGGKKGVTPLQAAVAASDVILVEKLLAHKTNSDTQDEEGNSPLSIALSMYKNSYDYMVENSNHKIQKIVALLLKHRANPDIQDNQGASALQISTSFHDCALMNMLLEAKANSNTYDKEGNSPLSCLVDRAIAKIKTHDYYIFEKEMEIKKLKVFLHNSSTEPNLLSKMGTSQIEYVLDTIAYEPCFFSSRSNDKREKLVQTLIEAPRINANLLNKQRIRLLGTVIDKGGIESVKLLLKKADSNLPDVDGTTPLQHAIRRNSPALVDLLLSHGAEPMVAGKQGMFPITEAIEILYSRPRVFRDENYEIIEMLLEKGADPNQNPYLLHDAVKRGDERPLDILMQKWHNFAIRDKHGKTVLQYAMENRNPRIIDKLTTSRISALSLGEGAPNPLVTIRFKSGIERQGDDEPKEKSGCSDAQRLT